MHRSLKPGDDGFESLRANYKKAMAGTWPKDVRNCIVAKLGTVYPLYRDDQPLRVLHEHPEPAKR
jgi:hypothetical protein